MKHLILPALLFLAACTTTQSNQTLLGANALYVGASNAGEALVLAGQMDNARFKQLDQNAYDVLLAVRAGKATIEDLRTALKPLKGE